MTKQKSQGQNSEERFHIKIPFPSFSVTNSKHTNGQTTERSSSKCAPLAPREPPAPSRPALTSFLLCSHVPLDLPLVSHFTYSNIPFTENCSKFTRENYTEDGMKYFSMSQDLQIPPSCLEWGQRSIGRSSDPGATAPRRLRPFRWGEGYQGTECTQMVKKDKSPKQKGANTSRNWTKESISLL